MDASASNDAGHVQEFDFWEFVTCAKCYQPFSSDGLSGPVIPFWLTECGHIVCNHHLSADRSCPVCNSQGIELMPLVKEMPAPMSEWFCSIPYGLDSLAQAAKFQQESLAALLRHYKSKSIQYRAIIDRMKSDLQVLKIVKKENEALRQQIDSLRRGHAIAEPGESTNANGKRRIVEYHSSSPRSIHTPLGPPRITLPPNQDLPPSLTKLNNSHGLKSHQHPPISDQPGSRSFARQFSSNSRTPQIYSNMKQMSIGAQESSTRQTRDESNKRLMPPPPTPNHVRQVQVINESPARKLATSQTSRVINNDRQFRQIESSQLSRPSMLHVGDVNVSRSGGQGRLQTSYDSSMRNVPQIQNQIHLGQTPRRFVPPRLMSNETENRFVIPVPKAGDRPFTVSMQAASSVGGHSVLNNGSSGHQKRFIPAITSQDLVNVTSAQAGSRDQRAPFQPPSRNGFR